MEKELKMFREIFEGKDKQLSFMRVALTPSVLTCASAIIIAAINKDPATLGAAGATLTGILFAKATQAKHE
jgi:hypothetical protein